MVDPEFLDLKTDGRPELSEARQLVVDPEFLDLKTVGRPDLSEARELVVRPTCQALTDPASVTVSLALKPATSYSK